MMQPRHHGAFLVLVYLAVGANAQYWKPLGLGCIGPTEIQTIHGDIVMDRLLAGGTFVYMANTTDTILGLGQAAWDGARWDSLATRINPWQGFNTTNQTFWFFRYQGRLYACGNFNAYDPVDSTWAENFARLDETTMKWKQLECPNPDVVGMQHLVMPEPQDTLYATGYPGSLCGYPESCVFQYDGSQFLPWSPFDQIPYCKLPQFSGRS